MQPFTGGQPGFAESLQGLDNRIDSKAVGVTQRASTERSEPGSEDHREVHIGSRCDNPVPESHSRLVDHGIDQPLDPESGVGCPVASPLPADLRQQGRVKLRFPPAALPSVDVKTPACFPAQDGGIVPQSGESIRWTRPLPEPLVKNIGNLRGDIVPDLIHQLERPHRHTEAPDLLIHRLGRIALRQQSNSLVEVGSQHPVHQEAGSILAAYRDLPETAGEGLDRNQGRFCGPRTSNDLDQGHALNGIKEMKPNDAPGTFRRVLKIGNGQG